MVKNSTDLITKQLCEMESVCYEEYMRLCAQYVKIATIMDEVFEVKYTTRNRHWVVVVIINRTRQMYRYVAKSWRKKGNRGIQYLMANWRSNVLYTRRSIGIDKNPVRCQKIHNA